MSKKAMLTPEQIDEAEKAVDEIEADEREKAIRASLRALKNLLVFATEMAERVEKAMDSKDG